MADLRMPDINSITIAGNLTSDPVLRTTTNGTSVANFPIAYSRKFKDNSGNWREDSCYVGVVAWYKLAESCYENLMKGSAVMVEGELKSKSWKTENGYYRNVVEIKAKRIQFLNKKPTTVAIDDSCIEDESSSFNGIMDDSLPLAARQTGGDSFNANTLDEPPDSDKHEESDEGYLDYDKLTL